jgi:hypothetical protein
MDTRYNADPQLHELEKKLWKLQDDLAQAATPLQKRLAQAAIAQAQRDYRAIPQGQATDPESAH